MHWWYSTNVVLMQFDNADSLWWASLLSNQAFYIELVTRAATANWSDQLHTKLPSEFAHGNISLPWLGTAPSGCAGLTARADDISHELHTRCTRWRTTTSLLALICPGLLLAHANNALVTATTITACSVALIRKPGRW
jgi:hypothetical protein